MTICSFSVFESRNLRQTFPMIFVGYVSQILPNVRKTGHGGNPGEIAVEVEFEISNEKGYNSGLN